MLWSIQLIKDKLNQPGVVGPFYFDNTPLLNDVRDLVYSVDTFKNIHAESHLVQSLFRDSALISKLKLFGCAQYILWRTNAFYKSKVNSAEVPWHHDKHFQNGNENIDLNEFGKHVSVLVALDDVHEGNGAFEYISGSHKEDFSVARDLRPFHLKRLEEHFVDVVAEVNREIIPMKKGQFILFHSALLHRTKQYSFGDCRMNLVARLCSNDVMIPSELIDSTADIIPL